MTTSKEGEGLTKDSETIPCPKIDRGSRMASNFKLKLKICAKRNEFKSQIHMEAISRSTTTRGCRLIGTIRGKAKEDMLVRREFRLPLNKETNLRRSFHLKIFKIDLLDKRKSKCRLLRSSYPRFMSQPSFRS